MEPAVAAVAQRLSLSPQFFLRYKGGGEQSAAGAGGGLEELMAAEALCGLESGRCFHFSIWTGWGGTLEPGCLAWPPKAGIYQHHALWQAT